MNTIQGPIIIVMVIGNVLLGANYIGEIGPPRQCTDIDYQNLIARAQSRDFARPDDVTVIIYDGYRWRFTQDLGGNQLYYGHLTNVDTHWESENLYFFPTDRSMAVLLEGCVYYLIGGTILILLLPKGDIYPP